MAFPTIRYDAAGGSDTAASGSATTSDTVYTDISTGETVTGTGASNTITFSGTVDLSDVLDDDTDAIWVGHAADEPHIFQITGFTGGKATCTALTVVPALGATDFGATDDWAIGGKRKTFEGETRRDWEDYLAGWTAEFDVGNYDITDGNINPAVGDVTDGPLTFESSAAAIAAQVLPVIQLTGITTTNMFNFESGNGFVVFRRMKLGYNNAGASSNGRSLLRNNALRKLQCIECEFDAGIGAGKITYCVQPWGGTNYYIGCLFHNAGVWGVRSISGKHVYKNCRMYDNGSDGINSAGFGSESMLEISNCVIRDNAGHGIIQEAGAAESAFVFENNTVFNNTLDGLNMEGTPGNRSTITITGNLFMDNTEAGMDLTAGAWHRAYYDHNHFQGNATNIDNHPTVADSGLPGPNDTQGDPDLIEDTTPLDLTPNSTSDLVKTGPPIQVI